MQKKGFRKKTEEVMQMGELFDGELIEEETAEANKEEKMKVGEMFNPVEHWNMDIFGEVEFIISKLGRERFIQLLEPIIKEAENTTEGGDDE